MGVARCVAHVVLLMYAQVPCFAEQDRDVRELQSGSVDQLVAFCVVAEHHAVFAEVGLHFEKGCFRHCFHDTEAGVVLWRPVFSIGFLVAFFLVLAFFGPFLLVPVSQSVFAHYFEEFRNPALAHSAACNDGCVEVGGYGSAIEVDAAIVAGNAAENDASCDGEHGVILLREGLDEEVDESWQSVGQWWRIPVFCQFVQFAVIFVCGFNWGLGSCIDASQICTHVLSLGIILVVEVVDESLAVLCLRIVWQSFSNNGKELCSAHQFSDSNGEYGQEVAVPVMNSPDVHFFLFQSCRFHAEVESIQALFEGLFCLHHNCSWWKWFRLSFFLRDEPSFNFYFLHNFFCLSVINIFIFANEDAMRAFVSRLLVQRYDSLQTKSPIQGL